MFPIGAILTIISMLGGVYAYQYFMKPIINMESVDAVYSRSTKKDDTRIDCSFIIENKGKSKTKGLKLFSAFLKWGLDKTNIVVSPYDFTVTDVANITGGDKINSNIYKDINTDTFVNYTNSAQGLYMVIVLRWQSDNFVFLGRTFESHVLLFFQSAMKDNKMVFQTRQIRQKNFTHWFMKDFKKPDIFQTIKELDAKRVVFGDVSRFD